MSIVGTRPPLISETNLYEPHHKAVFDALGAKTYVINAQPDGTNINNNAGSTHIEGLQKYVDMVVGVISEKGYVVE